MSEDDLDIHRPLSELGLDSVMTVAIRRRLEKRLQMDVPATLLWTHPDSCGRGRLPGGAGGTGSRTGSGRLRVRATGGDPRSLAETPHGAAVI